MELCWLFCMAVSGGAGAFAFAFKFAPTLTLGATECSLCLEQEAARLHAPGPRGIHVQDRPVHGLRFPDQCAVQSRQSGKVLSWASIMVSKLCNREVNVAPRFHIFSEPISRKVGSWESLSASLRS
jgi:hypothetical protein